MREIIPHMDISTRLFLMIEAIEEGDGKQLCQDALDEIERLRAEVKKMKYLATL